MAAAAALQVEKVVGVLLVAHLVGVDVVVEDQVGNQDILETDHNQDSPPFGLLVEGAVYIDHIQVDRVVDSLDNAVGDIHLKEGAGVRMKDSPDLKVEADNLVGSFLVEADKGDSDPGMDNHQVDKDLEVDLDDKDWEDEGHLDRVPLEAEVLEEEVLKVVHLPLLLEVVGECLAMMQIQVSVVFVAFVVLEATQMHLVS